MEERKNTFPKREHLCGDAVISTLYHEGKSFLSYPVKVTYLLVDDSEPVRCLVWAPKRKFKHSVDRNRVRRQLREAYRKNKYPLIDAANALGKSLHFSMIYIDDKLLPSYIIEKKLKVVIDKLIKQMK
ncbi:MAG: ribonuclease P protein component [Paludibacteraceae bacterium]|jgi:ribonuclease P protein component|nr:ribonuclease P protein component [Paludibacteraceae bacterium]